MAHPSGASHLQSESPRPVFYRWLAVVPPIGMLVGPFVVNRVRPFVFGLPMLLAWFVAWVFLTSATMGLIYTLDRSQRRRAAQGAE